MTPKELQDALNDARKRGDKKAQQKIRKTQKGKGERGSRQSKDKKTQCE